MNKKLYLSLLFYQCTTFYITAEITPHVITFFIRPLPSTYTAPDADKVAKKVTQGPHKIVKSIIKKEINKLRLYSGIYASYAGYYTTSDSNGQITFPRKTAEDFLHVVVTEDVKVVPIDPKKNKTILGFVPDPNAELQYYFYEKKQDPETELNSWYVSEAVFPKNKKFPPDAILIYANPKHIIIPIGPSHAIESENLVLPEIYTTQNLASALNALRFFKIRQYFAPVKNSFKFLPDGFQERIN